MILIGSFDFKARYIPTKKTSVKKPIAKKSRLADELFFDQNLFNFDETIHNDTANVQTFENESLFDGLEDKNDFENFGQNGAFSDLHPEEFVKSLLVKKLNMVFIIIMKVIVFYLKLKIF